MPTDEEIYTWLYGPSWTPEEQAALEAATEQARTGVVLTDDDLEKIRRGEAR